MQRNPLAQKTQYLIAKLEEEEGKKGRKETEEEKHHLSKHKAHQVYIQEHITEQGAAAKVKYMTTPLQNTLQTP